MAYCLANPQSAFWLLAMLLLLERLHMAMTLQEYPHYIHELDLFGVSVSPSMALLSWNWTMNPNQTIDGYFALFYVNVLKFWPTPDARGVDPPVFIGLWRWPEPHSWRTFLVGNHDGPLATITDTSAGFVFVRCMHNPCHVGVPMLDFGKNYMFVVEQFGWFDERENHSLQMRRPEIYVMTIQSPGVIEIEAVDAGNLTLLWIPTEELPNDEIPLILIIRYGTSSKDVYPSVVAESAPTLQSCSEECQQIKFHNRPQPVSTTIHGLLPGTQYFYSLIAIYQATWAYVTNSSSLRTLDSVPYAPTEVRFAENGTGLVANWNQPLSTGGEGMEVSYLVQYTNDPEGNWLNDSVVGTEWAIPPAMVCQEGDCSLSLRVAAINQLGQGRFSDIAEWKPPNGDPSSVAQGSNAALTAGVGAAVGIALVSVGALLCFYRRHKLKLAALAEKTPLMLPRDLDVLPRVKLSDISIIKELGEGNFAKVFEGYVCNLSITGSDPKGSVMVAKTIRAAFKTLHQDASEADRKALIQEALTMRNLDHSNIVKLLGLCVNVRDLWLILEMMDGGDLLSYLRTMRPTANMPSHASLSDLLKITLQIANGCSYLNEMGYLHRDLAARNCLVDGKDSSKCTVKISDFGLTRGVYQKCYYRLSEASLFPIRWAAPEVLRDHVFTTGCDVWSFGITMWEILTLGDHPYNEKSDLEVIHYVREGGTLSNPEWCPRDMQTMLYSCWLFDAMQRLSFKNAANILATRLDNMPENLTAMPYMPAEKDAESFRKLKILLNEPSTYFDNPLMASYKPSSTLNIETEPEPSTCEQSQIAEEKIIASTTHSWVAPNPPIACGYSACLLLTTSAPKYDIGSHGAPMSKESSKKSKAEGYTYSNGPVQTASYSCWPSPRTEITYV